MLVYRNTTSAGYKVAVIPLMGSAGDRSLNRKAPVSLEPLHGNTTVIHADFPESSFNINVEHAWYY